MPDTSRWSRRLRLAGIGASVTVIVLLAVATLAWNRLERSLPQLDGSRALPGLTADVKIERDHQGVPTLTARTREDLARATGFVYAQDRFFQMDLLRRRSAGELAELFGAAALPLDRKARIHEFRALAGRILASLPERERTLLAAYADGVNHALQTSPRPWEYEVLRLDPLAWRPEDTILCIHSMALDLQDHSGKFEHTLVTLRETLGASALAFFAPRIGPEDSALDGTTAPLAPIPSERALNLRSGDSAVPASPRSTAQHFPTESSMRFGFATEGHRDSRPGSNSFGVDGALTGGPALLENDMHLGLSVPTVWYRARFRWTDPQGETHDVTGATLPGAPAMVVGSNGHVAWGFTNSYTDTGDLVRVQPDALLPDAMYLVEGRPVDFERRRQVIRVKGGDDEMLETRWTRWGPIVGESPTRHPLAYRWTFHDPAATNLRLLSFETARSVDAMIALAHETGIPPQNLLIAGRDGRLAWTIAGRLPERFGHDGRLPVPWAYGDRGWKGFLPPDRIPVIIAPAGGALWTANQRLVGGDALDRLGEQGYDEGTRGGRIRDRLRELQAQAAQPGKSVQPTDLLAVALDDRNTRLDRWHAKLLACLDDAALAQHPRRAELRRAIQEWDGRARVESISYRLVRAWRTAVATRALTPIFTPCVEAWPRFDFRTLPYELPLEALLDQRPLHLLAPEYSSWNDLLVAAADDVLADLDRREIPLAKATWGERNRLRMQHPFTSMLPGWLGDALRMPAQSLPGDSDMPRVQTPTDGASERMIVSPGREAEGIFHQPGGQSGHPLSPYFRAGHDAWVRGDASPFLPGAVRHTLTLQP
jgi:penicillin amidase